MSNVSSISDQLSATADEDLYPSSDGQPVAETDRHLDEMLDLRIMLRRYFGRRGEQAYVGTNLFVYYEKGNPRAVFAPDVFVARGVEQRDRRTYKLWQDGPAPSFVLEITSKSTRLEDKGNKRATCEMLGVTEYFLFDPYADYLEPPLQGYRLVDGGYQRIQPDDRGALHAETLGLALSRGESGLIELRDLATGQRLLRDEERASRAEQEKLRAEREAERQKARADEAERRLAELFAERERD